MDLYNVKISLVRDVDLIPAEYTPRTTARFTGFISKISTGQGWKEGRALTGANNRKIALSVFSDETEGYLTNIDSSWDDGRIAATVIFLYNPSINAVNAIDCDNV